MSGPVLPPTPAPLKSIQHYLKIAAEHDQRDPVVSYWCRLYALQTGLKLSTKTTEETNFLMKLMDWLESTKKALHDNEAITNNVAAQAHLENWALKLFMYADKNDRNSNFEKSTIQSFYTAGLLYDVITTFGDLTEEAVQNRKYAKWKAAYIHNCLKNGETPVPGPMKQEGDDEGSVDNLASLDNDAEAEKPNIEPDQNSDESNENQAGEITTENESEEAEENNPEKEPEEAEQTPDRESDEAAENPDKESEEGKFEAEEIDSAKEPEPAADAESDEVSDSGVPTPPASTDAFGFPSVPSSFSSNITPPKPVNIPPERKNFVPVEPNPYNPAPIPTNPGTEKPSSFENFNNLKTEGGVTLNLEQMTKAQKLIKWAGSALNYDDVPTTVMNLRKALHLLTTGQELP
ncbi:vacuolar protein sorting-associated protein VTA1 homolog isoform X3 [Belonocnema kinseyi]|uniref:vacuolar protein sorting-associated protein VTA1 homolog isoform X3 n=1 Tax=Belonocnema kinseyi TaxID=2817044 RepID=UPI00143CE897|nr:vacuolar protein sorting-associated protein VTA1 homolog isoform X3 [Belonocnema kinseyi]